MAAYRGQGGFGSQAERRGVVDPTEGLRPVAAVLGLGLRRGPPWDESVRFLSVACGSTGRWRVGALVDRGDEQ